MQKALGTARTQATNLQLNLGFLRDEVKRMESNDPTVDRGVITNAIISNYLKSVLGNAGGAAGGANIRITWTEWQAAKSAPFLEQVKAMWQPEGFYTFSTSPLPPITANEMLKAVEMKSQELDNIVRRGPNALKKQEITEKINLGLITPPEGYSDIRFSKGVPHFVGPPTKDAPDGQDLGVVQVR
jgi:hypothetical protein